MQEGIQQGKRGGGCFHSTTPPLYRLRGWKKACWCVCAQRHPLVDNTRYRGRIISSIVPATSKCAAIAMAVSPAGHLCPDIYVLGHDFRSLMTGIKSSIYSITQIPSKFAIRIHHHGPMQSSLIRAEPSEKPPRQQLNSLAPSIPLSIRSFSHPSHGRVHSPFSMSRQ